MDCTFFYSTSAQARQQESRRIVQSIRREGGSRGEMSDKWTTGLLARFLCHTHKYTQTTGKALCSLSRLPFQRNSRSRIEACPRSSLSIWWDGDTRKDPISVATRVQLHRKVSLCYSLTNIHHASAISTYTLIWEILRSCLYSCVGVGICTFPRSSCWCPWFPMRFLQDWDTISPFLVRRGDEVSWKTPPDLVKKCAHPFSHDLCKNIYSVNPFPLSTQLAQSNAD